MFPPVTPAPVTRTHHCPHCCVALATGWSFTRAGRCPVCRLTIGAERATTAEAAHGPAGSAAGLLANVARRADATPGDPDALRDAMNECASTLNCDVRRMRMLDYCRLCGADPALPPIEVVLATFSTWKNARATAAQTRDGDLAVDGPEAVDGRMTA